MPRYVAFLRAINVGGHTVAMAALRRHFEEVGCTDVETVIASGNVVFDSASRGGAGLEKRIARHLEARLGYAVATFLRTPAEVAGVAEAKPFARDLARPGYGVYVGFLAEAPGPAARRGILGLATPEDAFALDGRELYWRRPGRFSDSKISGSLLEKVLDQPMTLRNVTTVRRIAAKHA